MKKSKVLFVRILELERGFQCVEKEAASPKVINELRTTKGLLSIDQNRVVSGEKGKKTEYPRPYYGTLAVAGSGGRHIEAGSKDLQMKSIHLFTSGKFNKSE